MKAMLLRTMTWILYESWGRAIAMVQKMIPALPHAPSPAVAMLAIMISDGRR